MTVEDTQDLIEATGTIETVFRNDLSNYWCVRFTLDGQEGWTDFYCEARMLMYFIEGENVQPSDRVVIHYRDIRLEYIRRAETDE